MKTLAAAFLLLAFATLAKADYEPDLAKFLKTHAGYSVAEPTQWFELVPMDVHARKAGNVTHRVYSRKGEIIAYDVDIEINSDDKEIADQACMEELKEVFPEERFTIGAFDAKQGAPQQSTAKGQEAAIHLHYRVIDKMMFAIVEIEEKKAQQEKSQAKLQEIKRAVKGQLKP